MALPEILDDVFVGDNLPAALNEERDAVNLLRGEVATKIAKPSGAAFGDLLVWNGTSWVTTETRFLEGDGRPDGVVAGPVGSRYIDKTGAQGAVEWVKRAGADSNTGWICLAGDTGDRNIAADIIKRASTTVHNAHLQRSGQIIHFYMDITMPSGASPYKVYDLPAGFRPVHDIYGGLTDNKEGADTGGTLVASGGAISIFNQVSGKRDRYHGIWPTQDAWPTALPGA